MISKKTLSSIIDKYYLKGLCDSAVWKIKDKNLIIDFITTNSDMVGSIKTSNFDLEDTELAIYDTSLLDRQLQITSGDIDLSIIKSGKINTKLTISDAQFRIQFSLADKMLIPPVPKIEEPQVYQVEANLDFEAIGAMIKAKNALQKISTVSFGVEGNFDGGWDLVANFGDINDYSNKISYNITSAQVTGIVSLNLTFNSDILKEVLDANKGASNAKMSIFDQGLMKLEFNDEDITSTYFIVCKEG
jgi:hypothetical protein